MVQTFSDLSSTGLDFPESRHRPACRVRLEDAADVATRESNREAGALNLDFSTRQPRYGRRACGCAGLRHPPLPHRA